MGITQDPVASIGETPLFRGLAARRKYFPAGLMIDFPPQRLASTAFMKASEAYPPPPGSCTDKDFNWYAAAEAGCAPELASGPNLGGAGKEGGVSRHHEHRIGGFAVRRFECFVYWGGGGRG